jgi:hypothetical protein
VPAKGTWPRDREARERTLAAYDAEMPKPDALSGRPSIKTAARFEFAVRANAPVKALVIDCLDSG